MRATVGLLAATLSLLATPSALAQDSINPDAAADEGDGTQIVVPPRKPTSAAPADIRPAESAASALEIDADACRYAVQHVPSADTEYVAGVDANGNPVAPADLQPRVPFKFPTTIPIPITSNIGRMLAKAAQPTAATGATTSSTTTSSGTASATGNPEYRANALIGMVSLVDGRLYFNGQPIGDDPDAELAALCRKGARGETSGAR